jgi:hypothetical protein
MTSQGWRSARRTLPACKSVANTNSVGAVCGNSVRRRRPSRTSPVSGHCSMCASVSSLQYPAVRHQWCLRFHSWFSRSPEVMQAAQGKLLMTGLPIVADVSERTRSGSSRSNFEFRPHFFYRVMGKRYGPFRRIHTSGACRTEASIAEGKRNLRTHNGQQWSGAGIVCFARSDWHESF